MMSETSNTGRGASAAPGSKGGSRQVSALEATVPAAAAPGPADPAVDATVRIPTGDLDDGDAPITVNTSATGPSLLGEDDDLCGRTLQHFKVLARIGVGGMGSVYRALDLSLDREVALKVIRDEAVSGSAQRERFIREARSQAQLSHPNVVPIYYIGEADGLLFFAMELVEGEALDEPVFRGERIDWPRALELLHDVADALRMAHQRGIVHRDIKPSNLLVDPTGLVKVADFGLAKPVEKKDTAELQLTQEGAVLGSPLYMSPEQGQGEDVDHRSDIYSLGATFFHLLTGKPPFDASSAVGVIAKHLAEPVPRLAKALPGVPEGVARIIERMLAKDPAERFADYESLQRAVRAARPEAAAPAGFFVRAMAFGVDLALLSILGPFIDLAVVGVALVYFAGGWWIWGRTPGKWLFRLRVRTVDNEPPSLRRCLVRSAVLGWGVLLFVALMVVSRLVFGVWGVGTGTPAYASNPALARLLTIVAIVGFVLNTFGLLWAGFRRHKRAWHDLAAGTMVVYDLSSRKKGSAGGTASGASPLSHSGSRDR